jgi:hypothetical protein
MRDIWKPPGLFFEYVDACNGEPLTSDMGWARPDTLAFPKGPTHFVGLPRFQDRALEAPEIQHMSTFKSCCLSVPLDVSTGN